ncbi:hypothetical protein TA3x_000752 [Tundrisphaera sp. TA3]|uniref:hypothetical protein n=1 Tax=Tundrisphaera sp. TA3 TaxID=3435775 RepID=UPI003EB8575E
MMPSELGAHAGLDPARFRDALKVVYAGLDDEIRRLNPACAVSGRCCRFEEYGHTLFLSAPEAALLLADAPPPSRPLDDGATCPWQDDRGRCTAREARPLGCRVYFCDPAYQEHLPDVGEAAIARLKRLVEEMGLPWDYAPLHRHLRIARDEGRFPTLPVLAS